MRKPSSKPKDNLRKIGFEAPDQIHGAVKSIIGWAEMNGVNVSGKSLTEREFLQGLIAGFWASGQESWETLIIKNAEAVKDLSKIGRK